MVQMSNLDYLASTHELPSEIAESSRLSLNEKITRLEKLMKAASKRLEFEEAAVLRDQIRELKEQQILAG